MPGPLESLSELDSTTPFERHRFGSNTHIKQLFQRQLNRFPTLRLNGQGERRMYSEFGAYLIRPGGEAKNRLTHLVFPETTLSIPGAGRSLRGASDLSFPQAKLMAAVESDDLFAKVMADNLTADKLTQRVSLILSLKDVFFNSDLWDYFSKGDQAILSNHGFGPGMSFERWAIAIKNYTGAFLNQYENNGRITTVYEMPITVNQRGHVGTLNSYYQMPGFVIWAIIENQFSEQEGLFEIGSAHIHPEKEYSGISEAVASQLGERIAQMTLSPADVKVLRGSIDQHNQILQKQRCQLSRWSHRQPRTEKLLSLLISRFRE